MSEVCLTQLLGVHPTQLLLNDGATEIQQDKGPAQGHIEKYKLLFQLNKRGGQLGTSIKLPFLEKLNYHPYS